MKRNNEVALSILLALFTAVGAAMLVAKPAAANAAKTNCNGSRCSSPDSCAPYAAWSCAVREGGGLCHSANCEIE